MISSFPARYRKAGIHAARQNKSKEVRTMTNIFGETIIIRGTNEPHECQDHQELIACDGDEDIYVCVICGNQIKLECPYEDGEENA